MDKAAIRHFAVTARIMLLRAVTQRAFAYAVTRNGNAPLTQKCTSQEQNQRRQLIARIGQNGFSQTMEEAAYIWFNRFTALRYMEVNGFLPSRIRVFSDESGAFRPEILSEAMHLDFDGIDRAHILALLEAQDNDALYKYLLLSQCRTLHHSLPEVFGEIGGWTELLFPDGLLRQDSILSRMVCDIPEADWRDQVQIIGWLYQYYNTELKDQVFSDLKRNIKIPAESVPAATQLFTPDWIVRFMVENSLGRMWAEGHGKPEHAGWQYYLDEPKQTEAVRTVLEPLRTEYRRIQPESIRFFDPCMGSGHVLVYAFDLLMDIYTACGWSERDAALSILRHNLYGLDIDRRAYQLACFALIMKARQYNRHVLKSGDIQLNLANFADVSGVLEHAASYGSLLECSGRLTQDTDIGEPQKAMLRRIEQMLTQRYDAVVTNPPYMGAAGMNGALSAYVRAHYPDSKSDLFACFIERCGQLTRPHGYYAMITPPSFLFLSSFERLRQQILNRHCISGLLHMGRGIFGIDFGSAAFVIRSDRIPGYRGSYFRLFERTFQYIDADDIARLYLRAKGDPAFTYDFSAYETKNPAGNPETPSGKSLRLYYETTQESFSRIPGMPFVYWVSEPLLRAFAHPTVGELARPRQGLATGCNAQFTRFWYEVGYDTIRLDARSRADAAASGKTWFPYNKGGDFRKWYGNNDFVVNWAHDGALIRQFRDTGGRRRSRPQNMRYYFRQCITWSKITSGSIAFRYKPDGHIFDVAGTSLFASPELLYYLMGFCNSKTALLLINAISPTLNYEVGHVAGLPFIQDSAQKHRVDALVQENIALSRTDWDSFETSYDFASHPLL